MTRTYVRPRIFPDFGEDGEDEILAHLLPVGRVQAASTRWTFFAMPAHCQMGHCSQFLGTPMLPLGTYG